MLGDVAANHNFHVDTLEPVDGADARSIVNEQYILDGIER